MEEGVSIPHAFLFTKDGSITLAFTLFGVGKMLSTLQRRELNRKVDHFFVTMMMKKNSDQSDVAKCAGHKCRSLFKDDKVIPYSKV